MDAQSVSRLASVEIRQHLSDTAQASTDRYYATYRQGSLPSREYQEKSVRDIRYHLDHLCESLWLEDQKLFADYVCWAAELFAALGFAASVLPDTLDAIRFELNQRLAPACAEIVNSYFLAASGCLAQHVDTPSYLVETMPHHALATAYLEALLDGRRQYATQLILDAVHNGVKVEDIYLHVFQPTQTEIGRLWQLNRLSVAQEHYVTAATQFIMTQLYPFIFSTERVGARLIAASVGDELHELGIRMVADFFEMAGWDTYYIGANTPTRDLLGAISVYRPDVLAISATLTTHLSRVSDVIGAVRQMPVAPVILVGGYPFNSSPDLWRRLGADGTAQNAQRAVQVATALLA